MFVSAVILAAGMSHRMGSKINKQFILIGGKPILAHTIEKFEDSSLISEIVVVGRRNELEFIRKEIVKKYGFKKVSSVVPGGNERHNSAFNGFLSVSERCEIILSHDGARPFVSGEIIDRVVKKTELCGAAVAGVKAKDTVKFVKDGVVMKTPDRSLIWNTQTPQGFEKNLLLRAYHNALSREITETDDASIVENYGHSVVMVMGAYENIKITTPDDVLLGEALHFFRENSNGRSTMKNA